MPRSSATSSSTPSLSHASPDALLPRHRPVFPAHGRRIANIIMSSSVPPRAQRLHQKTRHEPRHLSPFSHVHLRAIGVLATGPESSPPPRSSSPANRLATFVSEH